MLKEEPLLIKSIEGLVDFVSYSELDIENTLSSPRSLLENNPTQAAQLTYAKPA